MKEEIKIFLIFFLVFAYFAHWPGWNENSRLDLTKAIVDEGRLTIDSYYNNTGDRSYINGHYYSDKAPGTSFLAVIPYAVWKTFWNILPDSITDSLGPDSNFTQPREGKEVYDLVNPGAFELYTYIIITLSISCVSGAVICTLMYKIINEQYDKKIALICSVALGFGTIIFYNSTVFMGHVPATAFLMLAYYSHIKNKKFLTGLFSAFAVITEYSAGVFIPILFFEEAMSFIKKKNKKIILTVIGLVLGLSPLFAYNLIITGSPFRLTRTFVDETIFTGMTEYNEQAGFTTNMPRLFVIIRQLIYPERGLFIYNPILLLSAIGLILNYKKDKRSIMPLIALFALIAVFSMYHAWDGGYSFGSRHHIIIIPFLLLGLPAVIKRIKIKYVYLFLILSIGINILSLQNLIDDLTDPQTLFYKQEVQEKQDTPAILSNPLLEYYLPNFIKTGPRSRILENLINMKAVIDIREWGILYGENFPFNSTFIPFLSILPLLFLFEISHNSLFRRKN